jgi:3-oxoacyl-[acyl-carrier protein] reductase
MDLGIKGRIALIGGGSKGLGRAVATSLAREGAVVTIMARNEAELKATAEEIGSETGGQVEYLAVDLGNPERTGEAAAATVKKHGRVDVLVNNAGGPPTGQFLDFSDREWESAFRLNLLSAVNLARVVVPGMKDRKWGRIINCTSIAVKQPIDGLILSNAVRAGVHGWAKSLANELAPFGITVNNILPGYTMTDRVRGMAEALARKQGASIEDVYNDMASAVPMGRIGRPEDFGELAAFLASEQAGYITGASIPIDGGFYKGLM